MNHADTLVDSLAVAPAGVLVRGFAAAREAETACRIELLRADDVMP